ncbi:MAG: aminopeptidase P family protein [Sandaracinus sp.]|nr:aminopeptidase P family protein [Sandaracinus sp.]
MPEACVATERALACRARRPAATATVRTTSEARAPARGDALREVVGFTTSARRTSWPNFFRGGLAVSRSRGLAARGSLCHGSRVIDADALRAHDASLFAARRARLLATFAGEALIPAGVPFPKNYPANPFPFRASSHFLYLVGLPLPGAQLVLRGDDTTLYVEAPAADDELWHGPTPSLDDLARVTGLRVAPLDAFAPLSPDAAVLLPQGERARVTAAGLLRREITPPTDEDLALQDAMIALRLVHDAGAIAELRRAAEATVAAHRAGMAATRVGVTEFAIAAAMEGELMRRGMSTSYGSIVSVRGEILHNHSHAGTTKEGDLLLADVGAETGLGFAGDVTRTWPVSGRFDGPQRALYEVVLAAQKDAIARCTAGTRYRDVHLAACRAIAEGLVGLGILRGDVDELVADGVHATFFPHGIGHLLGLDVHDMEDLGDRAGYAAGRERSTQFGLGYLRLDRDLQPGMAVTIEPGFYAVPAILRDPERRRVAKDRIDFATLEAFASVRGIRIEDDVLVTDGAPEVLTAALPKDAAAIEACVGA